MSINISWEDPREMRSSRCISDGKMPRTYALPALCAPTGQKPNPAATGAAGRFVDYSPTNQVGEEDVRAVLTEIGLCSSDDAPWKEEFVLMSERSRKPGEGHVFLRPFGVGFTRGTYQLWPNVTEYVWKDAVYRFPSTRMLIGTFGMWDLVSLDEEETAGYIINRFGALTSVDTVWTREEASLAGERYDLGVLPQRGYDIGSAYVRSFPSFFLPWSFTEAEVFTLDVPSGWLAQMAATLPSGRRCIETTYADLAYRTQMELERSFDVRVGQSIVSETCTAAANYHAKTDWAYDDASVRSWSGRTRGTTWDTIKTVANMRWVLVLILALNSYGFWDTQFIGFGWWAGCIMTLVVRLSNWELEAIMQVALGLYGLHTLWRHLTMRPERHESRILVNPRRLIKLTPVKGNVGHEIHLCPEGIAIDAAEDRVGLEEPPIVMHSTACAEGVPHPVLPREQDAPCGFMRYRDQWHFEQRQGCKEMVVNTDYYIAVADDIPPNVEGYEDVEGLHFQRAAKFAVGKGFSGENQIHRDWTTVAVRPGFKLEMSGEILTDGGEDYGKGRVTYFQSYGIPGYWAERSVNILGTTAALRVGQTVPVRQLNHTHPGELEWVFDLAAILKVVKLPKVQYTATLRGFYAKGSPWFKYGFDANTPNNRGTFNDLWTSMKPASKKRMIRLLESLADGTIDTTTLVEDGFIKIFVKGDELLFKGKPRLICFVPSVWWLLTVMWLSAVLIEVKKGWFVDHCGVRCYWASGMTQVKLSDTFSDAHAKTTPFAFVCGDDNIDRDDTSDASMYDSTQAGIFADTQFEGLVEAGLPRWLSEKMREEHEQSYRAQFLKDGVRTKVKVAVEDKKQVQSSLPSGAAWTLFLNSVGIIQYVGGVEAARRVYYPDGYPSTDVRVAFKQAVAGAMGLKMKVSPNPPRCHGAEFLKGLFVENDGQYWWTPSPSRLCKWAKAMHGSKVFTEQEMRERVRGVCLSNRDALLVPLLRNWVDAWVVHGGKFVTPDWEYRNITYTEIGGEEAQRLQAVQGSADWAMAARSAMGVRYGFTPENLDFMEKIIAEDALKAKHFGGPLWARLAQVDYLGWPAV